MELSLSLAAALALAAAQVIPQFMPTLEGPRRAEAVSAAAGFSVAFVFLELLPQVAERADAVTERAPRALSLIGEEALFLALVGLLVFYGLETLARRTGAPRAGTALEDTVGLAQIAAFVGYYALIGYLLWPAAAGGIGGLASFAVPVGVHFVVVDYGLRAHHPVAFKRIGRWLLAAAVLIGWGVGALWSLREGIVGIGIAFLAGGIILITLKEELPEDAQGRFFPFLAGATAYTVLVALL